MGRVEVSERFQASVHEAESYWYDTARWPEWVEGLARVASVSEGWPEAGSVVVWQSGPAGRGRVVERVVAYEPLVGQTVEVQDDSIRGRQSVSFSPAEDAVEISLELEYTIKGRSIFTPLVDVLFIRRAMRESLRRTVLRFGAELGARGRG